MKTLKILFTMAFVAVCGLTFAMALNGGMDWLDAAGNVILMAPAAPVVLDTQKIVFIRSLKEEYEQIPTYLNEAEDLNGFVEQGQTLVFPEAGDDPAVYKNKTDDVDSVEPKETVHKVSLDVYDSQNYKLRNINLHALPYNKVQYYTKKSSDAIVKKEIADAAYTFAPESDGNKRVILPTTGEATGGLKALTLADIIRMAEKMDEFGFPNGRNIVLPSGMWWQLVNNNPILKGQMERLQMNGVIDPNVVEYFGIKIHKVMGSNGIAWNTATSKKADQGAAIAGDIVPAGFVFCKNQVFRAGGAYEMFLQNKSQNTAGRAWEFGFQHRFKADFQMGAQRYSAMIYAAKADTVQGAAENSGNQNPEPENV